MEYDSYMADTIVTEKGTTTIPTEIRRALGIAAGTVLQWSVRGAAIEARKKPGVLNELQKRIRERAGSWNGAVSGKELLRRTRP
jgi:bifunctional DNA-binding transcriptional regulator/antitoxin component of YhaV-PrlF toxin-antitoxin module